MSSSFPGLLQALNQQAATVANETELRQAWIFVLQNHLGINFQAERGRRDSSYNNVVIEFKDKGLFRSSDTSPAFREAINDRLLPYILRTSAEEGIDSSDYIGIAVDGCHVAFAQVREGSIYHGPLLPVSEESVALVALALRDSFRRAVTADNLLDDFGLQSIAGSTFLSVIGSMLSDALAGDDRRVVMLFEEWRTLFGQVADLTSEQVDRLRGLLPNIRSDSEREQIAAGLFVLHTYNSVVMKLLAAEILSAHSLTAYSDFAQTTMAVAEDDRLLERISDDVQGGRLFAQAGISGFAEDPLFGWYLGSATSLNRKSDLANSLRELLIRLSLYRTDDLGHARSTDVLRSFYQRLIPEALRKALGEYYTPDWLVQVATDKAEPTDWLQARVLDPTCGSGSFLLEVIRRKRAAAEVAGWSPRETLIRLCDSVWGFDLNPLAVLTSRVNFLIAAADLLGQARGFQVEVPVLLADAIYSPARNPAETEDIVEYRIGSEVADLTILVPAALAFDRRRLDNVFTAMAESVIANRDFVDVARTLVQRGLISEEELVGWAVPLGETYQRIFRLHERNWNGIWFQIVRNFFWSATAGSFDLIIGNPPWVRWSKLPELYRERVKPTCEQYDIFSSTPHHGGNELDISAMITYTVSDKWLKNNGTLVFVITQSHFQAPSSEGFRRFRINPSDRLIPSSVDDLKALKPFPDSANKTAIAVFRKSSNLEPRYPVPYSVWKKTSGWPASIPTGLTKEQVLDRVCIDNWEATPVGEDGSPWAILPEGRFPLVQKLTIGDQWIQGRKGITADLNGIYFIPILDHNTDLHLVQIVTRPEAGRTEMGPRRHFWIEPNLLFPLIKGASDFSACYFHPVQQLFALVPNRGITIAAYDATERELDQLPRTREYFSTYEAQLRQRSTYRGRMPNAPYYCVYNVGDYTFAPFKVIWAEQSGTFSAAVATSSIVPGIGERVYVPDHKVFFVPFHEKSEAYFVCGLLNSGLVKEFVESHNISIQVGDIFKHMTLPHFHSRHTQHRQLASLVEQCHTEGDDATRRALLTDVRELASVIIEQWILNR